MCEYVTWIIQQNYYRDSKLKEMTLHKLDEMDKKLAETEKSKSQVTLRKIPKNY